MENLDDIICPYIIHPINWVSIGISIIEILLFIGFIIYFSRKNNEKYLNDLNIFNIMDKNKNNALMI